MARRDERGSGLIELVWLGILLLVPLVYILLSVFEVQRGAFAVSAAARASGRAYALADSDAEGRRAAEAVARRALADQGLDGAPLDLEVRCAPVPDVCRSAGATISVTVVAHIALPLLPEVLGGGTPSFRLDATHAVPFGQFREDP